MKLKEERYNGGICTRKRINRKKKYRRTPSERIPLRQQVQPQISNLDISLTLRPHQVIFHYQLFLVDCQLSDTVWEVTNEVPV